MTSVAERIRGALYGHAIGDAFGLGTEFMSKEEVKRCYPLGLVTFGQILRDEHRQRWAVGAWTDDTEQMLCIVDSLIEHRQVVPTDIAERLQRWVLEGGMGVGSTTATVVLNKAYVTEPLKTSFQTWVGSGRQAAANGGVMRIAPIGLWHWQNRDAAEAEAALVCRLTHFDPRCVASSVAVCDMLAQLVSGSDDVYQIVDTAALRAAKYHGEAAIWMRYFSRASLDELDLDEGLNSGEANRIGYTYKVLGAAVWGLCNAESFEHGITAIVHEGGDADTNACVAGGLLGARFAFSDYLPRMLRDMHSHQTLRRKVNQFLEARTVLDG